MPFSVVRVQPLVEWTFTSLFNMLINQSAKLFFPPPPPPPPPPPLSLSLCRSAEGAAVSTINIICQRNQFIKPGWPSLVHTAMLSVQPNMLSSFPRGWNVSYPVTDFIDYFWERLCVEDHNKVYMNAWFHVTYSAEVNSWRVVWLKRSLYIPKLGLCAMFQFVELANL